MSFRPIFSVLLVLLLLFGAPAPPARSNTAAPAPPTPPQAGPSGPFIGGPVYPYVWNGDLRDLPQLEEGFPPSREVPPPRIPAKVPATPESWVDPVAQTRAGPGKMPEPLIHFAGLNMNEAGGWHPPDTNGDVGPNHYIQVVNIAIGIFDKSTGTPLVKISYNDFFQGPPGSPCDNQNRGDVVALYDAMADRWIITDFSLPSGESHECIAVSQSGDPVSGGWYFYDLNTEDPIYGSWCDYPKLGVWPDAYYLSCNMFDPWIGAKVWALDRAAMLNGQPMNWVSFNAGSQYASLLPSNMKGAPPPAGSPNYFMSFDFPNTLHLWEFHVDWANPGNSTFTGPVNLTVADAGYIGEIPQPPPGGSLDSLGDRLMFSLHYRNRGGYESLWVNHTVLSNGVAGVRWYEVRDPGGTPFVYQQGTFQPDQRYRWMGSVATDQDGNMAVGYSIASTSMYPSIRYAGRLNGEIPGLLLQGEALMVQGGGSQIGSGSNRWGDYSLMTVDPTDDCTFWYTQEYMEATGNAWSTRIGAFRFPSCGRPKGWVEGIVYNADTLAPISGAPVVAAGPLVTMTVESDGNGHYWMPLISGTYFLTGGPLPPAYPTATVVPGVTITVGTTTTVNIPLVPMPYLTAGVSLVDDNVPGGNGNGYPEPGESGLLLYTAISNTGATTATGVTAYLTSLSPGLSFLTSSAAYPDIGPGGAEFNPTPFVFSIAPTVPCGARLDILLTATTDRGTFTGTFSLEAKVPLPIAHVFTDDMESGPGNWTTGGQNNRWQITTEQAHSPSHAWSDSPYGGYWNNTNAWLRSPILNLSGMTGLVLTFWHAYDLEPGWDYGYVEYSTNGGVTWQPFPENYTGYDHPWEGRTLDASVLDGHSSAAFRFRIQSDTSVTADGWYIDDVDLYYQPFECTYPVEAPGVPVLLFPPDGTVTSTHALTFTWEAGPGGTPEGYNLELDGVLYTTTGTFSATVLPSGLHTWRVRAYNLIGYSDYSTPWTVEVVDLPGVPVLLFPPDGTVTSTHALTFTWEAGPGGAPEGYNLELDGVLYTTTGTFSATVLPSGLHTWRVRAFNAAGRSAYTEPWTVEVVDLPGVPVLLFPPDGTVTSTHALTFTWEAGPGGVPEGYNLELDGVLYTTTGTFSATVLPSGLHTWRVRAYNALGYSDYSTPWTVEVVDLPGVPVLLFPPDGTVTSTHALTLTWEAGPGGAPEGYNLELDGVLYTTTEPFSATVLPSGLHTWRVRAYNAAGRSAYTEPWTVEVVDLPGVPVLLFPPDGTVTSTHALTLTWEAGPGGVPEGYNLELDGVLYTTTEPFSATVLPSGLHTWRVRAYNAAGYSAYTEPWTVEVVDLPGVPVLLFPPDGTVTSTHALTLTWEAGPGGVPEGYNLELDGVLYTTTGTFSATVLPSGLHTWRVRAYNAAGRSAYTEPWTVVVAYRVYLPLVIRGQAGR